MAVFLMKSTSSKVTALHEIFSKIAHNGSRASVMGVPVMDSVYTTSNLMVSKRQKHYHPDFRRHRWAKVLKIQLFDFDEQREHAKMSAPERRAKAKKDKQTVPRHYSERAVIIASTRQVIDPYVPPEGDGKASILTKDGAIQSAKEFGKQGKSFTEVRKVKKYEEDFDKEKFAQQAHDIYIKAHELLNDLKNNKEEMHDFVTESAFPEMTDGLEKKTVRWAFVESLEPPRVVYVRTTDVFTKDNIYAQITVRFHTRQTLAIYDRFGRLMYGGEKLIKDCLDYVVFEKHLSDEYGRWRLHSKIIPEWMPPAEPVFRTMRKPDMEDDMDEQLEKEAREKHTVFKEE